MGESASAGEAQRSRRRKTVVWGDAISGAPTLLQARLRGVPAVARRWVWGDAISRASTLLQARLRGTPLKNKIPFVKLRLFLSLQPTHEHEWTA